MAAAVTAAAARLRSFSLMLPHAMFVLAGSAMAFHASPYIGKAGCVDADMGNVPATRSAGTISGGYMPIGVP